MILEHKKVGETPLELLERVRTEKPEFAHATLSYAGRLDPMAEGVMLILVGDTENAPENRKKFLGLDKEYVATFLVGVKTDTGDALGLVQEGGVAQSVTLEQIQRDLQKILAIKTQKVPWFSAFTVNGIKLFDHFKAGNLDVERPVKNIEIRELELLNISSQTSDELKKYIFESIGKVHGDFRQEEILKNWQKFFMQYEGIQKTNEQIFSVFEVRLRVSSGTYIRVLTENFSFAVTLLKLKRTKIYMS